MKTLVIRFFTFLLPLSAYIMPLHAQVTSPDINKYTLAIKHNANDDAAWYNRGAAYFKLGKYDNAINDFSQSISVNANNFKALTARANTYFKLAKYDSAIADYSTVLDNEPDDKNDKFLLANRGDAYRMARRYKPSLVDYTDALGMDSTRDSLWYNRGIDYYKLGKNDSAVSDLSKALTLRPGNALYQVRIMLALSANDSYSQAASYYTEYTQKKMNGYIEAPEYSFLKNYIIACAVNLNNGDYKNALPLLLQSINAYKPGGNVNDKSDSVEYANIVAKTGYVYEKLDSLSTAISYYQKAIALNPDIPSVGAKISRITYAVKKSAVAVVPIPTVPPLIKLITPAPASTRGMLVDNDEKGKTRGIKIEADTNKDGTISVKGLAQSPSGISMVKINGTSVNLQNTDTTGYFETLISDTCTTLQIQAWNKQNIATDTLFHLFTKAAKVSEDFVIPPISDNENFHAIFIACTNYTGKWPSLDSTIAEAERLKQELVDEYSFKPENIVTLYNKNKQDILRAVYNKLGSLGEDDNVLIFYGGHGYLENNMAYWVPSLATDRLDYISNTEITDMLQNRQAKHILIMADACFSGALRSIADDYVPTKYEYRQPSRQFLTSGSAETVPGVSVFIPNIIDFLKLNTAHYYSTGNLYNDIYKPVQNESGRTPVCKDFQNVSNSSGGQFYFKRRLVDSNHVKTPEEIAAQKMKEENAKLDFVRKKAMYDSLVDAGKIEKDKEHLAEAVNIFQKAVAVNPDPYNTHAKNLLDEVTKLVNLSPDDHFRMCVDSANYNELKDNHNKALKWYNKALDIKPEKKETLGPIRDALLQKITFLERMDGLMKIYQYKNAAKEFTRVLKTSEDKEYFLARARCYDALAAGDPKSSYYNDALNDLNSAIAKEPTYLRGIKARAELEEKYGRKREAIDDYKLYLKIEDDISIYMKLYSLHLSKEINSKDEAIEDLSNAINLNTRYTEAYYDRGLIYVEQSNFPKALDDFNSALKLDPLPAVYYYYRGTCYINQNKIEDAAFDFKTARARNLDSVYLKNIGTDADDINFLATEDAAKKLYESALVYVGRAILVNPVSPEYRFQQGNYYYELKSYQKAIKSYDSAVYLRNDYVDALYKRGYAYFNLTKFDTALQNFDKITKLSPGNIPALQGKADSYFEMEDYANAITAYEQTLKLIDDNKGANISDAVKARLNNNLGYAYYQTNLLDQSIQVLKNAVNLDKNYATGYYNLGKSYEKSGSIDNAIEKIDKALSYDPNNYVWNYNAAGVYRQKGNFLKAVQLYSTAIQYDSAQDFQSAYYYRGFCYKQTGSFNEATKDYLTILKNAQDTAYQSFNNELGDVYYNLANYDSAYIFYKKSYNKDSSDANALGAYGLAVVLFEQKKVDDALVLFEKAFQTKSVPKNTVKADKNFAEFKNEKRFKDLYNKYF